MSENIRLDAQLLLGGPDASWDLQSLLPLGPM